MEPKKFGIKYKCPLCKDLIKFPTCPNADKDKIEALTHRIYTIQANEKRPCWRCLFKHNKK